MPKDMKDKIFECKSMAIYNKWQERFSKFVNDNNREGNLESIYAFFLIKCLNLMPLERFVKLTVA